MHRPEPDEAEPPADLDDPAVWARIVGEHQRAIFDAASRLLRDDDLARDVAQRTFVNAWAERGRFRFEASLRTWLLRIAHNLALNELRRAHRRNELGTDTLPEPDTAVWGTPDPAEAKQTRTRLADAVHRLPPRQRAVVLLRVHEDLSFSEIGAVVGIRGDNAKVSFHHALQNLRRALLPGRDR
jgi:RNA polymerase sigma-70 factor (ECF subfamily)